jgi:bacterial/archaeal transporter family-2 protein
MRPITYILFALAAFGVGAGLPVQTGVNSQLRNALGDPVRAATVQFAIGLAVLTLATLLFTRGPFFIPHPDHGARWWIWTGGIMGAAYVLTTIVAGPTLGATWTFALIVAGEMAVSLGLDHFGALGFPKTDASASRLFGVALVITGALLARR